ncbi:TonB-dependent receptor [Fulvivirgaceae bacterium BMA10]|uniref:TonB-dependent receptor n=1 Tax=Splendidivirga corallicola TaxID=3051826 RepID=A0ABT8KGN7_9BACT|nr:TonB-dependent receptor [Fulvivirgaceae bacterium BMA10]
MKTKFLPLITKLFMYSIYGTILQLFLCSLILAAKPVNAQKKHSLKDISISIQFKNDDLFAAFKKIEKNAEFNFVYNAGDLDEGIRLNRVYKNTSLYEVLMDISREAKLGFKRVNGNINVKQRHDPEEREKVVEIINDVQISGKITDENGQLLPGVNVLIKGTNVGVVSDIQGSYRIDVPSGYTTLVFSYIGYNTEEIDIGDQTVINVKMSPDIHALSEVVVIGYGTQERANVTSAISQVKSSTFKDIPVSSIEQGIASQLPGVNVVQASGAPGKDNQINIRGIGTITAGSQPLIVIDGLPISESTGLNSFNPNDVASVEVLKDAAAAAIYGSRGANGVVLITTKKGEKGDTKFHFDAYAGVQQVANRLDLMDAYEWSAWVKEARDNYYISLDPVNHSTNDANDVRQANTVALGGNAKKVIIPDFIVPYLNGQPGLTDTDWQDEIFRDARISNYQLSASGGSDDINYFISGNYFNQEGVVLGSDFERYTLRANIESDLSKKLKLGLHFAPSFSKQNAVPEGWTDTPVTMAINSIPVFSPYNPDGTLAISTQINAVIPSDQAQAENPVAFAKNIKDENTRAKLLGGAYLELEILKGLKAKTYLGIDYGSTRFNYFRPGFLGNYRAPAPTVPSGRSSTFQLINWINENTITYNKTFDAGHSISLLGGYSIQKENIQSNRLLASNFPNDQVTTLNAGVITGGNSLEEEWTLISYLLRATYDFKGKYLFSAAVRRDGSSRFGANNKWGVFPSFSAGWRMSDETFFPETDWISDLKLRASWGVTGNNQIENYGSQALLGNAGAILGGSLQSGLSPSTSPNANLSWEETNMLDVGLDIGLWEDKIILTADYYKATTDGLLLNVPVPAHSGFTSSLQNLGKVQNSGLELAIKANYQIGPLEISSAFNLSSNENEVLALGPGQDQIITGRHITEIGGPIGAHYGYRVLGVFNSQSQLDNIPHRSDAGLGDYIYEDVNGDGAISSADRTVLGSFWPDYTYGFTSTINYKNFDLSISLQGVEGVMVHDRLLSVLLYNPEGWGNASRDYWQNHYSANNTNAIYAKANPVPTDNGFYRETDLLHDDASYLRFRNITLGYNFPEKLLESISLESARVYFSSKNPFTFTDFRGYNPEQSSNNPLQPGLTLGNYPTERSFVFGVNLTF